MSALVKIEENKKILADTVIANKQLIVKRLPTEQQQKDFQENFLELAENDYLMDNVAPKHILTFGLNISKMGINISPAYGEGYILPFNVKGKGMMPMWVSSKQGVQQLSYDSGFLITDEKRFNLDGKIVSESEMTSEQQASIKTSDGKWVDEHFEGFFITMEDLIDSPKKLPIQTVFVGKEYCESVTKQLLTQDRKIQTWVHKAYRRATKDFFIPRGRRELADAMKGIDKANEESELVETSEITETPSSNIDMTLDTEVVDTNPQSEFKNVTQDDIGLLYTNNEDKQKLMQPLMTGRKELDQNGLNALYEKMKNL